MSIDHLQIGIIDTVYNNQTWLYESLDSANNDLFDALDALNTAFENIAGLIKDGALIASTDTSGYDNMQWSGLNPVYGGASYITSANATTLRNAVVTQVAAITNLNSYRDVAIRSYRNDLQASDGYSYLGAQPEGLEIFISGCKFQNVEYVEPSNVDTLLLRINNALDGIANLEFAGIVTSSTRAAVDNLFMGADDTTYGGNKYLSLTNATTLRTAILNAMAAVSELDDTNIDVEIKISKNDLQESD